MQSTPKFTAAAEPKPEAAAELSGAQLQQATNDWFTSKPAVGASIVEIGSWFRGQPANATFRFTGEDHLPILQWHPLDQNDAAADSLAAAAAISSVASVASSAASALAATASSAAASSTALAASSVPLDGD